MATPVIVDIVTYFYPVGNTSAVHLTRNLPRAQTAQILLLGCGDIRNIVFTVYMDQDSGKQIPPAVFDFLSDTAQQVSFDPQVAWFVLTLSARNILLLTLALDDTDGGRDPLMWNIYYHLYLDNESMKLLNDQATKLYEMAITMQSWTNGKYGQQFRFCDEGTLSKVRNIWYTYRIVNFKGKEREQHLQRSTAAMQRATSSREYRMSDASFPLNGIRAAAPAGICAAQDAPELARHYWEHGSTDKDGLYLRKPENINPTFVTDTSTLHYGTDPLLGFHLATAYAPLTKESPLRGRDKGRFKLVEVARQQFRAWIASFRQYPRQQLTMRFSASDAVAFSYALQQRRLAVTSSPAGFYRDSYHSKPLVLDSEDYLGSGGAPTSFTVIDTSNLIDHIGALNLLVASSPLLENTYMSSLYTQSLVKSQETQTAYIDSLLCGHFPSISTLLGLIPVQYWTNISSTSMMDDLMLDSGFGSAGGNKQMHIRLTWKQPFSRQTSHSLASGWLHFDEIGLARMLHEVYLNMFRNEDMHKLFAAMNQHTVTNNSLLRYNRRSFALFLRFVRNRVICNWTKVMDRLLAFIEQDSTLLMNLNYIQELYLCLHLYNVHSVDTFAPAFARTSTSLGAAGLKGWRNIPPVLCVTIEVPREKLGLVTRIKPTEIGSPILHCVVQSSPSSPSGRWQNIFSAIQLSFGTISTSGERFSDTFRVHIAEDKLRWNGSSPLLATFMAPTWMLLLEPKTATIAFGIQSTPASTSVFMKLLGLDLNLYRTNLGNERNVFFTKFSPNLAEFTPLRALSDGNYNNSVASNAAARILITATTDTDTGRIASLVGRLEGLSGDMKKELRNGCRVETVQTSPFRFTETLGSKPITLDFPAPVKALEHKTRIARKSFYIEVEAPLADATSWKSFPSFIYPTFLWSGTPSVWNSSYLNLDRLPVIDAAKKSELQWLRPHASGMFNTRERAQRNKSVVAGSKTDVRMAFKESLFTMFMSFTALQRQQTRLFSLNHTTAGGVHVLIFISNLRMDLTNHTVVLDAAVLLLTHEIVSRIGSFLDALSKLNICHIKVDSEELNLWKQALPALVERCRTWEHQADCEYLRESSIPLSMENGQRVVCSCGNGRFPPSFILGVPQWSTVSKYFVRAAVSPCFETPFSEQLFEFGTLHGCWACGKEKTNNGRALLSCGKCHQAKYCSADCQRADWTLHKSHCRAPGPHNNLTQHHNK
ncbi:hypothetical protein K505DRAFT_417911 [Melanomma pulvis-pyrius CBS 109.77]|uniref:MYND-type domain-containing protein n=1 Tax=Melanomma pulvis-pyrius CBS 109.77 TaxID=1314802 RepID=A0A6A6X9Z1_9PLEO|nr:hypothetical protein K505DRAFT_417911 [Melanomma pulvis-pyrius CBS 109.77]